MLAHKFLFYVFIVGCGLLSAGLVVRPLFFIGLFTEPESSESCNHSVVLQLGGFADPQNERCEQGVPCRQH